MDHDECLRGAPHDCVYGPLILRQWFAYIFANLHKCWSLKQSATLDRKCWLCFYAKSVRSMDDNLQNSTKFEISENMCPFSHSNGGTADQHTNTHFKTLLQLRGKTHTHTHQINKTLNWKHHARMRFRWWSNIGDLISSVYCFYVVYYHATQMQIIFSVARV